jgi:toxin ParE1/3/4
LKPVEYHSEASWEADDAAAYYYGDDRQTSSRFLDTLGMIVSDIQLAPQRWPFEHGTVAQRRQIKGFPYTLFYLNEPDKIFILAVAHTSRRPGYWKKRISVD